MKCLKAATSKPPLSLARLTNGHEISRASCARLGGGAVPQLDDDMDAAPGQAARQRYLPQSIKTEEAEKDNEVGK